MPAWTDRVLWSEASQGVMRQVYYNRAEINLSEHKPVLAVFEAKIKTVDKEQLNYLKEQYGHKFNQMKMEQHQATIQAKIKLGVVSKL